MSYLPANEYLGGWTDTVTKYGGQALDYLAEGQQTIGKAAAYEELLKAQMAKKQVGMKSTTGLPKWAIPAGIGLGVIILLTVLKKK